MQNTTNHTPESSRLLLTSGGIDTARLEHETDRLLFIGLLIAVLFHAGLVLIIPRHNPAIIVQKGIPITFQIKPPRLKRPFRFYGPQTGRREYLRRSFRPAQPSALTSSHPSTEISLPGVPPEFETGETSPVDTKDIVVKPAPPDFGKPDLPDVIKDYIKRKPDNEVSLREELLTIDDFDASLDGNHKGLVIYNPADQMSITGVVALPQFYSYKTIEIGYSGALWGLANVMNTLTDIRVSIGKPINFFHRLSEKTPFIYIGTEGLFEYSKYEADGIREFIKSGGFIVLEDCAHIDEITPAEASLKQFMRDAFGSQVRFVRLPNNHPVYHSYFHFDDGPPVVVKILLQALGKEIIRIPFPIAYLEGIYVNGEMVGIYSNRGLGTVWGNGSGPYARMGVNLLVYALRNASKVERYVDTSLVRGPNGEYADKFRQLFSNFTSYSSE